MDFDFSWDAVRKKGLREQLSKPQAFGVLSIAIIVLAICIFTLIAPHVNSGLEVITSANPNDASYASSTSDSNAGGENTSSQANDCENSVQAVVAVHVAGEVVNPGMYEIPEGSRVNDAVLAAGGFTEDADDTSVNLARTVSDGEQIRVPSKSDTSQNTQSNISQNNTGSANNGSLVNINTATSEQLQTINGIGPSTAQKIIEDRQSNGSFSTVDDLSRVSGIGEKKLESIRPYVTVG